jgi:nitroreductase
MAERHSNRRFDDKDVAAAYVTSLIESAKHCPSSCDRHGVRIKVITDRDTKAVLNGLLVGGVGWIYRAPIVLLLLADPRAYKAGDEVAYMPYLDAGVIVQQISLMATALGLHTAYANPNIRTMNREHFNSLFTPDGWTSGVVCCGAVAVGYPHPEPIHKVRHLDFDITVK